MSNVTIITEIVDLRREMWEAVYKYALDDISIPPRTIVLKVEEEFLGKYPGIQERHKCIMEVALYVDVSQSPTTFPRILVVRDSI